MQLEAIQQLNLGTIEEFEVQGLERQFEITTKLNTDEPAFKLRTKFNVDTPRFKLVQFFPHR